MGAIARAESGKVGDVLGIARMSSGEFSVYRDRLLKRGLVASDGFGYLRFMLPRFGEFVKSVS